MVNLSDEEFFEIFGITKKRNPNFFEFLDLFNEGLEEACISDKWLELFKK